MRHAYGTYMKVTPQQAGVSYMARIGYRIYRVVRYIVVPYAYRIRYGYRASWRSVRERPAALKGYPTRKS